MGIGDELITSGRVRIAQESDPRKVLIVFEKGKVRWNDIWRHNPRIARPYENGDFQRLSARENYLRPYMVSKTTTQWAWQRYRPPPGEIYFNEIERTFGLLHAGRIVLEPTIKIGASPNKQWPWTKWNKLAFILQDAGYRVTQVGPEGTPILEIAEHIVTTEFRLAAAVLSTARAAVLPEGGAHHAAAALGTPAVVIYGGFISPEVTGYDNQVNLFTGSGIGCGMRVRCECCERAMSAISPQHVADRLLEILASEESRRMAVHA